jgi:hypothetical protein
MSRLPRIKAFIMIIFVNLRLEELITTNETFHFDELN